MPDPKTDARIEIALHQMEVAAATFAARLIRTAEVRTAYVEQIKRMSQDTRSAVQSGKLSSSQGAKIANEMRNQIMEMQRARDFDIGRAMAQKMKTKGLSLDESITKSMGKLGFKDKPFNQLAGHQQRQVFMEVIESSGNSRPAVTQAIPRLRWAGRALWIASFAIAAYNIGTAENPWWQTGREATALVGGLGGGFAGGASMGAIGGIWAGPAGVAVGAVIGGVLGALLADHVYVEAAGVSDPITRKFINRFTSFLTGVDEVGMARALTTEYRMNQVFVINVFLSLNNDYNTDADDIAREYVKLAKQNPELAQILRRNASLRNLLIQLMNEGWLSVEDHASINYLRRL